MWRIGTNSSYGVKFTKWEIYGSTKLNWYVLSMRYLQLGPAEADMYANSVYPDQLASEEAN